jgi:hypothetical protein
MSESFDNAALWSERERDQATEIDRLRHIIVLLLQVLESCTSAEYAYKLKIKAHDAARAGDTGVKP